MYIKQYMEYTIYVYSMYIQSSIYHRFHTYEKVIYPLKFYLLSNTNLITDESRNNYIYYTYISFSFSLKISLKILVICFPRDSCIEYNNDLDTVNVAIDAGIAGHVLPQPDTIDLC